MAIICQILFCFVHCKRAADLVASRRLDAALDMKAEKLKVLLNVLSIDGLLANRPLFNESPGVFDMTGCPPLRRIFLYTARPIKASGLAYSSRRSHTGGEIHHQI